MSTLPFVRPNRLLISRRIYPLTSRPLTDLRMIFFLLPVLWLTGLEQILPPLLLAWAAFKLVLGKATVRIPAIALPFAIFLLWQIVSQLAIEQASDRIVFGRNLVSYTSAFLILFVIANDTRNRKDIVDLVYAIIGFSLVATAVALLFALGVLPARFEALIVGNLLPGFLRNSQFVQEHITLRVIGQPNAIFGPFVYPRVSSLFIFATGASAAYVVFLFWQWYAFQISRGTRRALIGLLLFSSLIVFLLTAARIAWGALLISLVLVKLFRYQARFRLPFILLPLLLILLTIGLVFVMADDQSLSQLFGAVFVNIRTGSLYDRLAVYEATLQLWMERPLTGWGAPKVVSGVNLAPAGTHSQLLGILFRFGLIGFLAYLAILALIWAQIGAKLRQAAHRKNQQDWNLIITIATIFLAMHIMYLSYEFFFDFTLVLLFWTTIGLIFSPALSAKQPALDCQPPVSRG